MVRRLSKVEIANIIKTDAHCSMVQINYNRIDDLTSSNSDSQIVEIESLSTSNVSDYASDGTSDNSAHSEIVTPTNEDAPAIESENESPSSSAIFGGVNSESNGFRPLSASGSAHGPSSQSNINYDMISSTVRSDDSDATTVSIESETSEISLLSPSPSNDSTSDGASESIRICCAYPHRRTNEIS